MIKIRLRKDSLAKRIKIRPFQKEDLDAVHKIVIDAIEFSYPEFYPPEAIDFFKEYHREENILEDAAAGCTIVAVNKEIIIGTGTLIGHNIRRVYISPKYQHKGIGRLITQELEKMASIKGLSSLDLSATLGSQKFWESMGFKVIDDYFRPVENGQTLHFYEMAKNYGMQSGNK